MNERLSETKTSENCMENAETSENVCLSHVMDVQLIVDGNNNPVSILASWPGLDKHSSKYEDYNTVKCAVIRYCACCNIRYALGHINGYCEWCSKFECNQVPRNCVKGVAHWGLD